MKHQILNIARACRLSALERKVRQQSRLAEMYQKFALTEVPPRRIHNIFLSHRAQPLPIGAAA